MKLQKIVFIGFTVILLAGCGVNLMPSKDDWYAKHYYIMQDFEWKAYKALSPAGRLEFQKMFWETRSPESRQEFDRRIEYCVTAFKRENSRQPFNVARAHVFLLNGRPAHIEYTHNDNWGTQLGAAANIPVDRSNEDVQARTSEVWTYPFEKFLVQYVFTFKAPNEWALNQAAVEGSRYINALELQNKTQTYAILDKNGYNAKLEELKKIKD